MKILKTFLFFLMTTLLMSCDSGENDAADCQLYDDVISSDDFLINLGSKESYAPESSYPGIPASRGSIEERTVKGYTSKTVGENVKLLITKDLANAIGISSQIYIVQYTNAFQEILIPGLNVSSFFGYIESPLCGLMPRQSDWTKRDYRFDVSTKDKNIMVLETICIHIICDLSGKSYDIWYPCKPEECLWNYTEAIV